MSSYTPRPRRQPPPTTSLYKVQLRGCAALIVLCVGIGLFVYAFLFGALLTPQKYEMRYNESHVYDYRDSYQFDRVEISLDDGSVPVNVEVIARTPPKVKLPVQIENHELSLVPKESLSMTWFLVADSKIEVAWTAGCSLRVVMVKELASLEQLQKDHAPDDDDIIFDKTATDYVVSAQAKLDDYYSVYICNVDRTACDANFTMMLHRDYYEVTKLTAGERGDAYLFSPYTAAPGTHFFIDSPEYPLVIFYTRNATGNATAVTPSHMQVQFHPSRRIEVPVLVLLFMLGFIFVVGSLTVIIISIQKSMMLYREMKVLRMYSPPEYARFQ